MITHVSRLRAALRFGQGVSRNSGGSRILSTCTGSARPSLVVNMILFYLGGPGSPHQQGWGSCSGLLSQLLLSAMVITTLKLNARAVGTVPMFDDSSRCQLHRGSDAINSIVTRKQLFDKENSEDLRNSSGRAHSWTNMADGSIGGR